MERLVGISASGVQLILEYEDGALVGGDDPHTEIIPTAIRLEAVDRVTRPVLSYKEIEASPEPDITKAVAYLVRGGVRKNGRELGVSVDLRDATEARVEIPQDRRAFFTDPQLFLGSSRIPATKDLHRKPMPQLVRNGERVQPTPGKR